MDHYADNLAAVVDHLDLHDAIHVGHSTGGEVVRYLARRGEARASKAAPISAWNRPHCSGTVTSPHWGRQGCE
jgi:non-heme chloroperoxidase